MTDKQIIHGVDVSGCLFYQTNFEEDYDVKIKHYCSSWHNSCESNNNSNCYYKQLQRKEQECERWEEINKYSQDKLLEQVKVVCKLKQTLAEIKPILEFYANSKMGEKQTDGTYKIMTGGGYIMAYDPNPAKEALKKINEVENGN